LVFFLLRIKTCKVREIIKPVEKSKGATHQISLILCVACGVPIPKNAKGILNSRSPSEKKMEAIKMTSEA
jgi:hypothetical protein